MAWPHVHLNLLSIIPVHLIHSRHLSYTDTAVTVCPPPPPFSSVPQQMIQGYFVLLSDGRDSKVLVQR